MKVKLATPVEGYPKAIFLLATTQSVGEGGFSFLHHCSTLPLIRAW